MVIVVDPVKEDLINEIIRISQKNLLGKDWEWGARDSEEHVAGCVNWIRQNAADYRKHYHDRLEILSASELGAILKDLSESPKDLSEILKGEPAYRPSPPVY